MNNSINSVQSIIFYFVRHLPLPTLTDLLLASGEKHEEGGEDGEFIDLIIKKNLFIIINVSISGRLAEAVHLLSDDNHRIIGY